MASLSQTHSIETGSTPHSPDVEAEVNPGSSAPNEVDEIAVSSIAELESRPQAFVLLPRPPRPPPTTVTEDATPRSTPTTLIFVSDASASSPEPTGRRSESATASRNPSEAASTLQDSDKENRTPPTHLGTPPPTRSVPKPRIQNPKRKRKRPLASLTSSHENESESESEDPGDTKHIPIQPNKRQRLHAELSESRALEENYRVRLETISSDLTAAETRAAESEAEAIAAQQRAEVAAKRQDEAAAEVAREEGTRKQGKEVLKATVVGVVAGVLYGGSAGLLVAGEALMRRAA